MSGWLLVDGGHEEVCVQNADERREEGLAAAKVDHVPRARPNARCAVDARGEAAQPREQREGFSELAREGAPVVHAMQRGQR